jgi:FkbM family methyltransferase
MKKEFITYAQDLEDWILFCALNDVQNGFYVDVGANDPCFCSVTKAFYDMGWNGINIEPLKQEYDKLCLERPRDINLNIGAGAENASLEFFIQGMTYDPETARRLHDIDSIQKRTIPVRRLSDILNEHLKGENKTIHFLKIDVEGFERSVLEGMDFNKYRAWIIIIEATLPGTFIPCHDKWEDILLKNNYEVGFAYGINRYYVDKLLDRKRNKKINSGFAGFWIKIFTNKIEQKFFPENYSHIKKLIQLKSYMHGYTQYRNNLLSIIFRGIIAMYRGIKAAIKFLIRKP